MGGGKMHGEGQDAGQAVQAWASCYLNGQGQQMARKAAAESVVAEVQGQEPICRRTANSVHLWWCCIRVLTVCAARHSVLTPLHSLLVSNHVRGTHLRCSQHLGAEHGTGGDFSWYDVAPTLLRCMDNTGHEQRLCPKRFILGDFCKAKLQVEPVQAGQVSHANAPGCVKASSTGLDVCSRHSSIASKHLQPYLVPTLWLEMCKLPCHSLKGRSYSKDW